MTSKEDKKEFDALIDDINNTIRAKEQAKKDKLIGMLIKVFPLTKEDYTREYQRESSTALDNLLEAQEKLQKIILPMLRERSSQRATSKSKKR